MRKLTLIILLGCITSMHAQTVLTLDSCRALALRNNKQINIARLKQDVALNTRKAARTKYLPHVDLVAGYELTSREISLLSQTQKDRLGNMGTLGLEQIGTQLTTHMSGQVTQLVQKGLLTPQQAQQMGALMQQMGASPIGQYLAQAGNTLGSEIVKAFDTDTKNVFGGAIMLRQPIYMGGAITAANRMADISERMASDDLTQRTQATLYEIDNAYWTVVSLRQKKKLAESFRALVKKLDDDVQKMIGQGVATRADGLKVNVKVNEADMNIVRVDDGLSLAKMLLCQLCGLPLDQSITLADEQESYTTALPRDILYTPDSTLSSRPEVRMLQDAVALSEQATRLVRAEYLPHIALTGGYALTNPNVYNGFQKRFSGVWNVGVMIQVPVWNWFEGTYKVRAARSATQMARMQLSDARQKIQLQIAQSRYKLNEAHKRLSMSRKNILSAEENLRCAQVGFREGVMQTTDVMAAQTAWQQAQSQYIDAEVDVRLSSVNLQKALGILQ